MQTADDLMDETKLFWKVGLCASSMATRDRPLEPDWGIMRFMNLRRASLYLGKGSTPIKCRTNRSTDRMLKQQPWMVMPSLGSFITEPATGSAWCLCIIDLH